MEEAPGRVAILDYFESYGKALNVSASFKTTAIGVRYYDADKKINGTTYILKEHNQQ